MAAMAEPSKHERDIFDQDEDRGRSQRTDNVKVFNGTYLTRDALSGMEARFRAYGDVAADGHDLKVFRVVAVIENGSDLQGLLEYLEGHALHYRHEEVAEAPKSKMKRAKPSF
jgi:hypothetical protein